MTSDSETTIDLHAMRRLLLTRRDARARGCQRFPQPQWCGVSVTALEADATEA